MNPMNPKVLAFMSQSGIILSTFLLSVGSANALSPQSQVPASPPTAILAQARQELQQQREQQQFQAEANRILSRTMTLFNILLAILVLLLATAIIALFLLRQAVIREVSGIVTARLKDLGELELRIADANQSVQKILQASEDTVDELDREAADLQQEIAFKR